MAYLLLKSSESILLMKRVTSVKTGRGVGLRGCGPYNGEESGSLMEARLGYAL